jgi:hypothetical protein
LPQVIHIELRMKIMKVLLSSFFSILSLILSSQEYVQFSYPTFSFSLQGNWKELNKNLTPLDYGKYVKVTNGIIGGGIKVNREVTLENLESIWNIKIDEERKEFQKVTSFKNIQYSKEILNGLKSIKVTFEFEGINKNKLKEFKTISYRFLIKQGKKTYVINFLLTTEKKDYENDLNDLLKIIMSLNFEVDQAIFNSSKEIQFGKDKYIISKPVGYNYFSNSIFKEMTINDFTKVNCFDNEINNYNFELLVPKDLKNKPTIHIYTLNEFSRIKFNVNKFQEYKQLIFNKTETSEYEKILNSFLLDSLKFCDYKLSYTKPCIFVNLRDEERILSNMIFIFSKIGNEEINKLVISNYIHINNIIVFIKLTMDYNNYSDINNIKIISKNIVTEFLKRNDL